ncbi:unnamed protein product, partial [Owenia fusiformis]
LDTAFKMEKLFKSLKIFISFRNNAKLDTRTQLCRLFSAHNTPSNSTAALDGIRVLDLTRVLAGPYCTMILGDLGADIIKVERPGAGDDTRTWGPPFCGSESAYFLSINRNKKSICVNMKSKEGQDILQKLASKSDVLIENYIPGTLDRMGLGYNQLKEKAPSLIYCSITGYGQHGPYKKRAGYDVIASGIGGLMHITGPMEGEPCRVGVAMTDLSTGLYAYGAIMAALLYRQKTGKGQHIDCNLLATQVATLSHVASNFLNAGIEAQRWGTGHVSLVPYQAFKTSDDKYITVGAGNNAMFAELCQRMDTEHFLEDPRYKDNEDRVENRKILLSCIQERFSEKSLSEWMDVFDGCGFPYGPINNIEQVFNDPQVQHCDLIQEMEHSTVGNIKIPGPAVKYSESKTVLQGAPPTLGQHTSEVLTNMLGYSTEQLERLYNNGTVQ